MARKRHGYGLAQGDVLLNEPATASSTVKKAAEVAFANAGYRTVDASDTSTTAPTVRIDIKGFWLWLEPGVMVGTIRSRIRTEVALGSSVPLTITAETFQPGQIFSEEAWTNAVAKAITEFTTLLSTKIAALKS